MDDYSGEDEKLVVLRHPKKVFSNSGTARLKEFIHPDDLTTPFLEEDNQGDVAKISHDKDTEQTKVDANISNN